MATTTSKAIRDRIETVAGAVAPTVHAELPFVAYRDESGADFRRWARSHPALCTRRFQVRTVANVQTADVTNTDVEARLATLELVVAYSKRWRAGQSFDRDDTMEADRLLLERAIGRDGYANFAGVNPNASWMSPEARGSQTATSFERDDDKVDFLVIRQTMRFYLARVTAPPNVAPVAAFSSVPTSLDVVFTDASTDSDGAIVAWAWDFGDGSTSTSQNPSHTYAGAGTYTVQLTVTDDGGATDSVSHDVTATAAWTSDATSGKAIPQNATEAAALLTAAGINGVTTLGLYLFGSAPSGNIADASGNGKDLTASGTIARQQSVVGWSAKSMKTTNNTVGKAVSNGYGNVNANSYTVLLWALEAAFSGAVTRTLLRFGTTFNADACFEIINSATNIPRIGNGGGGRVNGAQTVSGSARPYVLRIDQSGNKVDAFTDLEKVVAGARACSGTELCFGGDNVNTNMPPGCDYLFGWVLNAALSDAQLRTLLQTCGWTIPW